MLKNIFKGLIKLQNDVFFVFLLLQYYSTSGAVTQFGLISHLNPIGKELM